VSAVSGAPELPAAGAAHAAAPRRRLLVLAGVVAGVTCLFFLAVALLIVLPATRGYLFGGGPNIFSTLVWMGLIAAAGLATALVIAIVALRSPYVAPAAPNAYGSRAGRTSSLAVAVAVAGVSCLLLLVVVLGAVFGRAGGYISGFGFSTQFVLAAVGLLAVSGLVAGLVIALTAVRQRVTSLRTRAFVVIIVAMVIPALLLAGLGTYAYFMSWERATVLFTDQASYQARELSSEIAGLSKTPGRYTPAERALLGRAITDQYGAQNHLEGALWSTLSAVRQESVLPVWAVRSLERRGFAIGRQEGPTAPERAEFVAWRVGPSTVRYYMQGWSGSPFMDAYAPLGRLLWIALFGLALIAVLGVLGAWILSRSVVRPVRRLAEASHRIADAGGVAEPVTPAGPRELRDLATSFNDMSAKLAKAQETEQAFLLSVSHELKTPLTSIRGYAEGIGDGTVRPPEGAAVIGAESSRLERLVGDLLDSGRMRKSAFTVRREAVDLAALAQDVARRYEGTAREAGLTLLMNTDAGGSAVADNDRLLQVVSNLVENAIRCTPSPGTVTIATAPGTVTVSDTGRGLTSDDLPRAFERFYLYSRYGNDRPVGTGLGLAIVKELTEAMGGTVSVSSAVGVGTAFTVALPRDDEAATVALPQDVASSTAALPRDDAS